VLVIYCARRPSFPGAGDFFDFGDVKQQTTMTPQWTTQGAAVKMLAPKLPGFGDQHIDSLPTGRRRF